MGGSERQTSRKERCNVQSVPMVKKDFSMNRAQVSTLSLDGNDDAISIP